MYGHKSPSITRDTECSHNCRRVTQKGDPRRKKAVRFRTFESSPALFPHKQSPVNYCHQHSDYPYRHHQHDFCCFWHCYCFKKTIAIDKMKAILRTSSSRLVIRKEKPPNFATFPQFTWEQFSIMNWHCSQNWLLL